MKVKNIAILEGAKTTTRLGVVQYTPAFEEIKSDKGDETRKEPLSAEIRTDIRFSQGIIKFKFKAADKKTGVLITSDAKDGKHLFSAGLSLASESFRLFDVKTKSVSTNGGLSQFKANEEIEVRYEIFGSEAKLFVNNILYCELNVNISPAPLSFRITSSGKVSLYDIEVESVKPKLFVVMQFTEDFNNLYNDVIIPVSEKAGFEVIRADEFYSSTPILNDIIRSIKESSVIIADITPDNPNVITRLDMHTQ